jgi:hypothetical protein
MFKIEVWSCGGMALSFRKRNYNKMFGYGPSPGVGAGTCALF